MVFVLNKTNMVPMALKEKFTVFAIPLCCELVSA